MSYVWVSTGLIGDLDWCKDNVPKSVNDNFRKIDQLLPRSIIEQVAVLPGAPNPGDAYILTTDNSINVFDNGQWFSYTPKTGFLYVDQSNKTLLYFNGMAWETYQLIPTGADVVLNGQNINTEGIGVYHNKVGSVLQFRGIAGKDGLSTTFLVPADGVIHVRSTFKFAVAVDDSAALTIFQGSSYKGSALGAGDEGLYWYYDSTFQLLKYWDGTQFELATGGGSDLINIGTGAELYAGQSLADEAEIRTLIGENARAEQVGDEVVIRTRTKLYLTTTDLGGVTLMNMTTPLSDYVQTWLTANAANYGIPDQILDYHPGQIEVSLDWGYTRIAENGGAWDVIDNYSYSRAQVECVLELLGNDGGSPPGRPLLSIFRIRDYEDVATYKFARIQTSVDGNESITTNAWNSRNAFNAVMQIPKAYGYYQSQIPYVSDAALLTPTSFIAIQSSLYRSDIPMYNRGSAISGAIYLQKYGRYKVTGMTQAYRCDVTRLGYIFDMPVSPSTPQRVLWRNGAYDFVYNSAEKGNSRMFGDAYEFHVQQGSTNVTSFPQSEIKSPPVFNMNRSNPDFVNWLGVSLGQFIRATSSVSYGQNGYDDQTPAGWLTIDSTLNACNLSHLKISLTGV